MTALRTWAVRKAAFPFRAVGELLGTVDAADRTDAELEARKRFAQPFTIEPQISSVENLERALRSIKPRREFDRARRFVRAKPAVEPDPEATP